MRKLTLVLAATIAGCATPPEAIQEAQIPLSTYSGKSCEELATAYVASDQKLREIAGIQSRAATNDTVGIMLIGLPVASMAHGNNDAREKQISQFKGEKATILRVQKARGCLS